MSVYLAEFIGVTMLIFFGCGVLAGNSLKTSGSYQAGNVAINIAWGCTVAMVIYCLGDISGAHINPAVTIMQAVRGNFEWSLVPGYIVAQIAGGMFGGLLVYLQFIHHWEKTDDPKAKLTIFATAPTIRNNLANFFSEYIVTFALVFCILGLDTNTFPSGLKPLAVGCLIFLVGTSFGGVTGAALNPARDLGPRLAHLLLPIPGKGSSDFKYAWIPVVAPIMGAVTSGLIHLAMYDGIVDYRLYTMIGLTIGTFVGIKLVSKNESEESISSELIDEIA
ncbi:MULTISPECIES: MIP/aquaporin family protein [Paraclostridium]|uniref:Aquaporin family protein n=1 Tax=Paraclostridium bifermentans TaxID=1490 RepID=A0AA44DLF6_PARBF|nr:MULTISPECIES: MIP/aquaporin family protein [Paraclostridium]MDV8115285.1 MIP/aquaporin family protein [Bacillus sp. BAU-SS-2023]EQK39050.1 MIP channel s family protein [[Clostridium] bifermentans ATCC 19299] [Paraclostridium bifermentans ATCC 19299]MBN8047554.1 aquaporin family protein [Paraclostridium bifermentans]MDU0298000.1 MIP/aquaporin family protein [Paraclostridium sp. MRS3W1]NME09842.1 aquaporin family protein [Paraclostridium bifermentans]